MEKRDVGLVALSALVPDFDSFGAPFEVLSKGTSWEVTWFSDLHHVLGHNFLVGILTVLAVAILAKNKVRSAGFAFLMFHIHLLGDIVGAKGPDGEQWPIPYFFPINKDFAITWSGQWEINAWPNLSFTIVLMFLTLKWARDEGYSFLYYLSEKADTGFVKALRDRFPLTKNSDESNEIV